MITLSWVALYEGASDRAYFDVLIPRILVELTGRLAVAAVIPSTRAFDIEGREIARVAQQVCRGSEAARLFFAHADTGGRALEADIAGRSSAFCHEIERVCAWPPERCVLLTPRKEAKAWVLGDAEAVMDSLRLRGDPAAAGLPRSAAEAEALADPKQCVRFHRAATRTRQTPTIQVVQRI